MVEGPTADADGRHRVRDGGATRRDNGNTSPAEQLAGQILDHDARLAVDGIVDHTHVTRLTAPPQSVCVPVAEADRDGRYRKNTGVFADSPLNQAISQAAGVAVGCDG